MAPSRGLIPLWAIRPSNYICRQCRIRAISSSSTLQSGHNRWSKIKHDKAKVDATKNKQRSIFAKELYLASKLGGAEPNHNPRLADLITKAKREGFAKSSIEAAIARGQGRSTSGASLENVTIEGMLPNNVAVIIECETDNRLRTLQEVRLVLKIAGGTTTPTNFLFEKKGRVTFEAKEGVGLDEILEPAVDAGAMDVDEGDEGRLVVWTEPGQTQAVGEAVSKALELQIATSEILWEPNAETRVNVVDEEAAQELTTFIDELHDKDGTVQAISMNVTQGSISSASWTNLLDRLTV